jgi:hypothetical protein
MASGKVVLPEGWLTVQDVTRLTGLTEKRVRQMSALEHPDRLPAVIYAQEGGKQTYRFRLTDIEAYIEAHS